MPPFLLESLFMGIDPLSLTLIVYLVCVWIIVS